MLDINTEIQISRAETSLKKEIKIKRYPENQRREDGRTKEAIRKRKRKSKKDHLKQGMMRRTIPMKLCLEQMRS